MHVSTFIFLTLQGQIFHYPTNFSCYGLKDTDYCYLQDHTFTCWNPCFEPFLYFLTNTLNILRGLTYNSTEKWLTIIQKKKSPMLLDFLKLFLNSHNGSDHSNNQINGPSVFSDMPVQHSIRIHL